MYTLDANIFVRDAHPSEPEHAICHALLERLDATATRVIVPLLILAEVAGAVSRARRDAIRARVFVDILCEMPHIQLVPLEKVLARAAADLAADYGLRGADALYVAVAQQYGCRVVSLDQELRTRAAPLVTTLTPAEALAELEGHTPP